jgi:hypothetical protein
MGKQPFILDTAGPFSQAPVSRRPGNFPGRPSKRLFHDRLDAVNDLAENVADGGTKNRQNDDNYDGNQNKNQRVFDQSLAFLLHFLEHGFSSFP